MGLECAGAWEGVNGTCVIQSAHSCDRSSAASDAICQCVPPNGTLDRCDESTWPDKKLGIVCGDCKVLVNDFRWGYSSSCAVYCSSMNMGCVGGWDDLDDNCLTTDTRVCGNIWSSRDTVICQCDPDTPAEDSCEESTWHVQKRTCGDCKVLVDNFEHQFMSSCEIYCTSLDMKCVRGWEGRWNDCAVSYDTTCNNWSKRTSDGICQCNPDERPVDRCDETAWPDVRHVCGDCKVRVDNFESLHKSSCAHYCSLVGLQCTGAQRTANDKCRVKKDAFATCDYSLTLDGTMCRCDPDSPYVDRCSEESWPGLRTTCGDCRVSLSNWTLSDYGYTCGQYCSSVGLDCADARTARSDNCVVWPYLGDQACDHQFLTEAAVCICDPPPTTTSTTSTSTTTSSTSTSTTTTSPFPEEVEKSFCDALGSLADDVPRQQLSPFILVLARGPGDWRRRQKLKVKIAVENNSTTGVYRLTTHSFEVLRQQLELAGESKEAQFQYLVDLIAGESWAFASTFRAQWVQLSKTELRPYDGPPSYRIREETNNIASKEEQRVVVHVSWKDGYFLLGETEPALTLPTALGIVIATLLMVDRAGNILVRLLSQLHLKFVHRQHVAPAASQETVRTPPSCHMQGMPPEYVARASSGCWVDGLRQRSFDRMDCELVSLDGVDLDIIHPHGYQWTRHVQSTQ